MTPEDHSYFFKAYSSYLEDRIGKTKRGPLPKTPIIKCKICCLKAPAASNRALICEMCFDDEMGKLMGD